MTIKIGDTVKYMFDPRPGIVVLVYADMIDIKAIDGAIMEEVWIGNCSLIPQKEYFVAKLKYEKK